LITDVRGRGLLIGMEVDPDRVSARTVCEHLMEQGILTKDTHETVVRLAPPLIIDRETIDNALTIIGNTLLQLTE
jgi:ornithine--oxo-acid transaminase